MTETQLIIALCGLWMVNGFALGIVAGVWYMDQHNRKLNGKME